MSNQYSPIWQGKLKAVSLPDDKEEREEFARLFIMAMCSGGLSLLANPETEFTKTYKRIKNETATKTKKI